MCKFPEARRSVVVLHVFWHDFEDRAPERPRVVRRAWGNPWRDLNAVPRKPGLDLGIENLGWF